MPSTKMGKSISLVPQSTSKFLYVYTKTTITTTVIIMTKGRRRIKNNFAYDNKKMEIILIAMMMVAMILMLGVSISVGGWICSCVGGDDDEEKNNADKNYYNTYYYYNYYNSLIRAFHISVSRWFFTGVWVTASLLKSSGFFLVFWPFSIMLLFGWSLLVRQLPSPLVPLVIL